MMRLVKYLKQNTTLVWTRMNRMLCPTKTLFKSLHTVLGCLLIPRGTSSSRRPHWISTFVWLYEDNQMAAFLIFTFHDELEVAAGVSVELLLRHQALGLTQLGQEFPLERWLRRTGINQFEIQPSAPCSTSCDSERIDPCTPIKMQAHWMNCLT